MITHPGMLRLLRDAAEAEQVAVQYKEPALDSPESNPRECYRWSVGVLPSSV